MIFILVKFEIGPREHFFQDKDLFLIFSDKVFHKIDFTTYGLQRDHRPVLELIYDNRF